ncbi:MAG: nitroreductase family protein [Candidatus Baldrarchaeia archaeon]
MEEVPEIAKWTWKIIKERRAIRDFIKDKPVPDDYLYRIIEAACQAPSPENYQPWRFIIIKDKEMLRFIRDKAIGACIRMFGVKVPRTEAIKRFWYMVEGEEDVFSKFYRIETSLHVMANGWRMCYYYDAPVMIAVVVDTTNLGEHGWYRMPTTGEWPIGSKQLDLTFVQAGLAVQNMWLMAHALGLGMCVHNFETEEAQDETEIAERLGIPYPRWRIAVLASIGWPARPRILGPKRYTPEQVTFSERFGNPYKFEKKPTW